jgi:hypothetical protein
MNKTEIQDPLAPKIAQDLNRKNLEEMAGKIAAATALPGPLVDVFSPKPNIEVGPYSVRPFYDLDFELLQKLEHPFAAFATGNTEEIEKFIPTGQNAWALFWLLTRCPADCYAEFGKGIEHVRLLARTEFGALQLGALFVLYRAVVKQLTTYASSVVGYELEDGEKKTEGKASPVPPSAPQVAP